jgi:hypothetical protein
MLVAPVFEIVNSPYELLTYVAFFALGIILGQGAALASWLVWGEGPFLRRLVVHWGIATALWCVYVTGLSGYARYVGANGSAIRAGWEIALCLPLLSLAGQLPLWLVREVFGWRLKRGNGQEISGPQQLTIRGLLWATLVVALSLACARSMEMSGPDFWAEITVGCALLTLASALAVLPAAAMLLGRSSVRRGAVATGAYAAISITLMWTIAVTLYFTRPAALAPGFLFGWFTAMIAGCAVTLILAGIAARAHGCRLLFRRAKHP